MTTIRRSNGARLAPRTFGSIRSILWVRFDPGVKDVYDLDAVRVESSPRKFTRDNNPSKLIQAIRGANLGYPTRQRETGPFAISNDLLTAVRSANLSLAAAIQRVPADGLTRFIDVQPTRSSRKVNSYRLPDELDLSLSWKALPFDSRLIRAIFVLHYEGTVPADAWATRKPEADPSNPSPTGYLVPLSGRNLRFIGQVDEVSDEHDGNGDEISLKCRDLTAVLIDTKIPRFISDDQNLKTVPLGVKVIRPGTTILQVIRNLLDTNPGFEIIDGPYARISPGAQLPLLDPKRYPRLAVPTQERHRGSDKPYVLRNSSRPGDESYWDAITDLCVSHGLVPTIEKNALVLLEPRTLYRYPPTVLESPGVPSFPAPGGHRDQIGDLTPYRRMVYGVNIERLRFFRKLGRIKAPAVQVTSYNPDALISSKRLLSVIHPPNAAAAAVGTGATRTDTGKSRSFATNLFNDPQSTQATKVSPTGKDATIEVHNVIIQGVVDLTQLKRIAEQVYESIGRQEFGIAISTNEIASYSENELFDPNEDPDLLDLRAGDPIRILIQPAVASGRGIFALAELNRMVARSRSITQGSTADQAASGNMTAGPTADFADAISYLKAQGFDQSLAEQLVKVIASANLPEEFRVNTVQIDFDGSDDGSGFALQIDARDYMRVRADPDSPSLEEPASTSDYDIDSVSENKKRRKAIRDALLKSQRAREAAGK